MASVLGEGGRPRGAFVQGSVLLAVLPQPTLQTLPCWRPPTPDRLLGILPEAGLARQDQPRPGSTAQGRRVSMPRKTDREPPVPAAARPAHDAIVALTDAFCREHLNAEYEALCRKLAAALARKRPSPLARGKPEVWACAVVRVIGWVNFLDDSSQKLHMKLTAIDKAFGVAESTGQGKAKAIRDLLKIRQFDFHWMLRKRIEESSMDWMVQINGFLLDARHLRREVQEDFIGKA